MLIKILNGIEGDVKTNMLKMITQTRNENIISLTQA